MTMIIHGIRSLCQKSTNTTLLEEELERGTEVSEILEKIALETDTDISTDVVASAAFSHLQSQCLGFV